MSDPGWNDYLGSTTDPDAADAETPVADEAGTATNDADVTDDLSDAATAEDWASWNDATARGSPPITAPRRWTDAEEGMDGCIQARIRTSFRYLRALRDGALSRMSGALPCIAVRRPHSDRAVIRLM